MRDEAEMGGDGERAGEAAAALIWSRAYVKCAADLTRRTFLASSGAIKSETRMTPC